ncbi:DUF6069 family protein [Streptosporangium sp. CA-115845]|uniref:DUF6069 family protein n=1 Tax=Streptosporangium sp. CA-115845 TaxID=3240071 RepID=UPI003D90341F
MPAFAPCPPGLIAAFTDSDNFSCLDNFSLLLDAEVAPGAVAYDVPSPFDKETDVSVSTSIAPDAEPIRAGSRPLWLPGLAFAAGGAVAATLVAAAADAAGVPLEIAGEPIPLLGFTQLAFVFSVVGIALAAAFRRRSGQPARAFVRTTVALVTLSFLPDLLVPDVDAATRVTLILTHIAVAVVVIPGLSSRLR